MLERRLRNACWILRLGLIAVLAYAAIAALITPSDWVGFMPKFVTNLIPAELALRLFSIGELVLAGWLLIGWRLRYAAWLTALLMIGIILSDLRLLATTFRDIAIAAAAVALATLSE